MLFSIKSSNTISTLEQWTCLRRALMQSLFTLIKYRTSINYVTLRSILGGKDQNKIRILSESIQQKRTRSISIWKENKFPELYSGGHVELLVFYILMTCMNIYRYGDCARKNDLISGWDSIHIHCCGTRNPDKMRARVETWNKILHRTKKNVSIQTSYNPQIWNVWRQYFHFINLLSQLMPKHSSYLARAHSIQLLCMCNTY